MENKEMTPEVKARIEAFYKDLQDLVKKHNIDLVAGLQYTEQVIIPVVKLAEAKVEKEEKTEKVLTK
jgi:hypothetical protein